MAFAYITSLSCTRNNACPIGFLHTGNYLLSLASHTAESTRLSGQSTAIMASDETGAPVASFGNPIPLKKDLEE